MKRFGCMLMAALAGLAPAGASDLSPSATRSAQELYDVKCAKCHKFYHPADYTQQEWDRWMKKMARKAKLKPAQADLLAQYLQTFRDKAAMKSSGEPKP